MIRRRFLVLICAAPALCTGLAHAQWVRAGGDAEVDAYVDPSTRVVDGPIVKLQVLLDYREPRQWSDYLVYASVVSAREYDCAGSRQRVAMSAFHFQSMATDEPRFSMPGGSSWKAVGEDGIDRLLWESACKGV